MPAPTKLKVTDRFFQPEISKVYFLPAIASADAIPTRAEINAGTDLTAEIAGLSGFSVTSNTIDTPDLASRFTRQIPGRTTTEKSSITFWASKDGDDVRKVLVRGAKGYVMFCDGGDVPGQPADVFPVEVLSQGKQRGVGDTGFQITVDFSVPRIPAENVAIPAA